MKVSLLSLAALVAITAVACSKQEVGFDTLETARRQAKENAEYNAKKFRADSKVYAELNMIVKGDSSQTPVCPQGDGWASIDLVDGNGQAKVKLKCSTVSDSVGCREDKDFKASPYAGEDGNCQPTTKVPHPLPKIAK